jgi:hypothetical protein
VRTIKTAGPTHSTFAGLATIASGSKHLALEGLVVLAIAIAIVRVVPTVLIY